MNDAQVWTLDDDDAAGAIARQGFVHMGSARLRTLAALEPAGLDDWRSSWDRLPPDRWLLDGGRYRRRRHGCFVHRVGEGRLEPVAHRAHWQPVDYNALHGGIERLFEPLEPTLVADPGWHRLLIALGDLFGSVSPADRWFIEAHQFRIDTTDGVGRPTPEGAHRDGVDFVAVILVDRHHVKGGETRVFEADGPRGLRFVIREPWSAVLLDDLKVIHETTPIQPDGADAHRDTLVLTYRRGGFLSPGAPG
ncbi:MAG: hypothetical protein RIS35_1209 [Pseudomonadota bacterium]